MKKNKIIFKNFSSRIIFSGFNIILGFIVTPLLIRFLGKNDFSLFKLTYDWLATIGFLEQALTSAVLAILANVSNEKRDHFTVYTFKKLFSISFIFILITLMAIPLLPHLFQIPVEKINTVRISFFIGSLGFIFLPITVLKMWVEFHEKSYLLNSSRLIQNILQSLLAIVFSYLTFGIIGQFSALFIGQFLFAIIVFYLFKKASKLLPQHELSKEEKSDFKKLFIDSNKNGILLSLCSKLSFFSDTLLLGFFFSPVAILPFTLTQKLIQMIQENMQSIGNASWASLVDLYRNGAPEEFENQLHSLTRIIVFFSLISLLPLSLLNKSFISLWVGEQFYAGFFVTIVAIINTYFMSIFSLWGWCLSGTGKIRVQIPIYVFNAVINFTIGLIFIKFTGLIGPIIGTLAGFVIAYSWLIPKTLASELNLNPLRLLKSLYSPFLIIVPVVCCSYFYSGTLHVNNFYELGLYYSLLTTCLSILMYFVYLTKNEQSYIKKLVLNKIGLKKTI